jgi:GST-like protein
MEYPINRFAMETKRQLDVLDRQLAERRFIAGDAYSIADIAVWPWTRYPDRQGVERDELPNFKRWFDAIAERPAVQRGVKVLEDLRSEGFDDKAREVLFGAKQYARR